MSLRIALFALAAAATLLGGCATVSGTPTQAINVQTVDARGYPIDMRCRLANGAGDYFGNSPLRDVQVRRSASDLSIECKRGESVARATAIARGSVLGSALLPGGSIAVLIDHFSGYAYAYPRTMVLRIGEHRVFDDRSASVAAVVRPTADAAAELAADLR